MMERLTARSPKNNMAYLVKVKPTEQEVESPFPNTLRCIMESFERLAQYEDAEEEGRLIILPYKIGDTVYYHSYYSKGILQGNVKAITIDEHGAIITVLNDARQVIRKSIDKTYKTRDEAERAKGVSE